MEYLGRLDTGVLEKEFGQLQTDRVIITDERFEHIREKHSSDIIFFRKYGIHCVNEPDFIVKDERHEGTVFMIKQLPDTNLNIVIRIALVSDDIGLKNSVMTCYRIRNRNLKKLLSKNKLLYRKQQTVV